MRVAYLCPDFGVPVCGVKGASVHVRAMTAAMTALGHDVLLLAARKGGASGEDLPPKVALAEVRLG